MFEDLYKQANDKIDIDAPKSRVMARLSKSHASVVRKSHKLAKVAALAACFVLTIAVAGIYENVEKETLPQLAIKTAGIPTEAGKTADTPVAPTNAPVAKKAAAPAPATPKAQKQTAVSQDVQEQIVAEYKPEASVDAATTNAQEEKAPSQSGGGGSAKAKSALVVNEASIEASGAVAARTMIISEEKSVSVEEYCEYLGKNIPEVVNLPAGVENETTPVQNLPANEDKFTFLFAGDEKLIKIETTKNTEAVQEMLENPAYEKSLIENNEAVVLRESESMKAYLAPGGIGYEVTMVNCTEPELENLLISLN